MRTISRLAVALLIGVAGSLLAVSPASAVSCSNYGHGTPGSTYTYAWSTYAGCNIQARIDRYNSGVVYSHYGSWASQSWASQSWAYGYEGYSAGNAYRIGASGWYWL